MTYATALQAPVRSQWDADSGSFSQSQTFNCGPTGVAFIGGFYLDRHLGIEATRRLVAACCRPTDLTEQRDMLIHLGIPAANYQITSLGALKQWIGSGRRPVILRILMSRVPRSLRGYDFAAWHTIVAVANGSAGVWVMDPNLRTGAFRYYPDSVMQYAFIDLQPAYATIPLIVKAAPPKPKPKPVPQPNLPDTATEDDMFAWVAEMARQNPKPVVVRKGTKPLDNPDGTTHGNYTFSTDTLLECIGSLVNPQFWACRRYGDSVGLFLIRSADVKEWPG